MRLKTMIENVIECPQTPLAMYRHFSEFCPHPPNVAGWIRPW